MSNGQEDDEIKKLPLKEQLECQKIQAEIARSEEEKKKIELEREGLERKSKSHLYKNRHIYQALIAGFILVPLIWFYIHDIALPLSSRENIKLSKELMERNQELNEERKELDEMILQHAKLQDQKIQLEGDIETFKLEKDILVEKNAKLGEEYKKKNQTLAETYEKKMLALKEELIKKDNTIDEVVKLRFYFKDKLVNINVPATKETKEKLKQYNKRLVQIKDETEYSFEDWYYKGISEAEKEETYYDAVNSFTKAIEKIPTNPYAYNARGATYGKIGKNEQALTDYNKSIELLPNNPLPHTNKGFVYHTLGKIEEAEKEVQIVEKLFKEGKVNEREKAGNMKLLKGLKYMVAKAKREKGTTK